MNQNNLAHKNIELENEVETLKLSQVLSEQEINLPNLRKISSYVSQVELEEISEELIQATNSQIEIKSNKIDILKFKQDYLLQRVRTLNYC